MIELIYATGFEVLTENNIDTVNKDIDKVIKDGYTPVNPFSERVIEMFIPVRFEKGIEYHPAYSAWIEMLMKCYDPSHPEYKNEGAKGITVDTTWINSFEKFLKDTKFSTLNVLS